MKKFLKHKFIGIALKKNCITDGIAICSHDSIWDEFWEGTPWKKRKTIVVTYEYMVDEKRYFKNLRFVCKKGDNGKFIADYPYKLKVYYSIKNPKVMIWEKDDGFDNFVQEE